MRGAVAVVHPCTLVVARAGTHPRGETFLGGKGRCGRADFGNDLLRGVHSQTRHFRQPLNGILVLAKETGHLLVQFADLLVDQSQFLQCHLQQPPVDGVQLRTRTERVAQLFRRGTQALIRQSGQSGGVGSPSAIAFSIRRALRPSRSETRLDNLICASSRRDSNWFCSRTRSHLNWYFLRVTVRHRRCSSSGTKLKVNSRATSRFTRRSASGKSLLRPRRPRLDSACARCNVPDLRLAPSRFSRTGFQYLSSAAQTG